MLEGHNFREIVFGREFGGNNAWGQIMGTDYLGEIFGEKFCWENLGGTISGRFLGGGGGNLGEKYCGEIFGGEFFLCGKIWGKLVGRVLGESFWGYYFQKLGKTRLAVSQVGEMLPIFLLKHVGAIQSVSPNTFFLQNYNFVAPNSRRHDGLFPELSTC